MSAAVRIADLPWPGLYVLRSEISCRLHGHCEVLHVVSAHALGEIRGYQRTHGSDGPFALRTPARPELWEEIDVAVASLVGAPCNGFGPRGCCAEHAPTEPARSPPRQLKLDLGAGGAP